MKTLHDLQDASDDVHYYFDADFSDDRERDSTDDEREQANTGDWNEHREDTRTDDSGYDGYHDNTGGAGSTGSAATNS
jgi:hypothetical protein